MDRVEDIERAIHGLSRDEFRALALWVREREHRQWDEEMDRDAASGRLDFLFEESENEAKAGIFASGRRLSEVNRNPAVLASCNFRRSQGNDDRFTVRVGDHHSARMTSETAIWVWIGTHSEYDRLVDR